MTRRVLEGCHARLRAIRESIPHQAHAIPQSFYNDYCEIIKVLRDVVDDDFAGLDLGYDVISNRDSNLNSIYKLPMLLKLNQLIGYLEAVHQASSKTIEIGSIYNSIKDAELKSRCGDLLSASDHFDRVINQATQVLEDRVRQKCPSLGDMTGLPLVGRAINPEPTKSMVIFSSNPSEQEGYAGLFKGLIGAFRNPSHHKFLNSVTREQALQICAFIDNMLSALEGAQVQTNAA